MARSYAYTAMNRYAPMQKAGGAGGGGAPVPATSVEWTSGVTLDWTTSIIMEWT